MSGTASQPTPNDTRNSIVEILGNSVRHALGLQEYLEDERQALVDQDAETLVSAAEGKSKCIDELHSLENERSRISAAAGFQPGPGQMGQLQQWCDEDASIATGWQRLLEIAQECNDLNMSNGAIIRVRKQQVETSLSIVRGGSAGTDTYGRNGTESGGQQQRSLAEA